MSSTSSSLYRPFGLHFGFLGRHFGLLGLHFGLVGLHFGLLGVHFGLGLLGVSCPSGGVSLCRRPGRLVGGLSFLLGGRVVFSSGGILPFWWGIPLSLSWWSCERLVFFPTGSWVDFGFLALPFALLTFGALGLIRRSRCATALPAMDNVAPACHVSGTASPFPPLQ